MARYICLVGSLLAVTPASADWVILADGQRIEVQAVEIGERAVHITTRAGKSWSVLRDTVDVEATRAANETPPPLEVVTIAEAPSPPSPTVSPPPPPREPTPPPEPPPALPVPAAPPPRERVVEREPAAVPAAELIRPAETPTQRYRFSVTVNGVQGADVLQFADTNRFELFREPARIESIYRDPRPQGLEIGVHYRVAGPFAVGATWQRFDHDRTASFTASLPHPFFFDRFRELSGTESGLSYEENAVHVDAIVTKTWGPLTLEGFGGPSWFETRTEVLVDILYDETFPYNEVSFRGVEGRVVDDRPLGYNVGASATFRVASIFGVDFGVRYSAARSNLFIEEGREVELDVGGLRFGAGLRFLFP